MTARPDSMMRQASENDNTVPGHPVGIVRSRFLSNEPIQPDEVRGPILASWRRSVGHNVNADALMAPYEEDLDLQGPLIHASAPVLDQLQSQLSDQSVSIVLTDADGFVLDRRTGELQLRNHLDRVSLAPGFSYAEQFVGTNGIGTALEAGQATLVHEQEHFTGPLVNLACAGVPIQDPVSGVLAGVLDITCFADDANPLLMALAVGAAYGIQARMLHQSRRSDVVLLQAYLRASRRSTDPILAVNEDVVMMNTKAQTQLAAQDQAFILERLREGGRLQRRSVEDVDLPSGIGCRLFSRQADDNPETGTISRVQLTEPRGTSEALSAPVLPGIVGSGGIWRQCCRELDGHYREQRWALITGERGAGKSALAEAVARYHDPQRCVRVLDCERIGTGWADRIREELDGGAVVLRGVDRVTGPQLVEVTDLLENLARSGERPWVSATVTSDCPSTADLTRLLRFFPYSVAVPPLRHHIDDVQEIADFLLQRLTKRPGARFTDSAVRVLKRRHWPGNVAELQEMVQAAASRTRASAIGPEALPPRCNSQNRRILTPLESMERDAIVNALVEANSNRSRAARTLGISRATIYRKIAEYGIEA